MRQNVKKERVDKELPPNISVELLKALHILTRTGDLNADSRRKLKQVQHLIALLKPAIADLQTRHASITAVDCGSGKSYLGLLLKQAALRHDDKIVNIEQRVDLVKNTQKLVHESGMANVECLNISVADFAAAGRLHLVTALHACDTATDDALFLGIRTEADYIAVVPCCQAEVARQLKGRSNNEPTGALYAEPIHRREFGSHLTNVLRVLTLQSYGYQVSVTELVGWEHSLKNEMILARRVHKSFPAAEQKLRAVLEAFQVRPKLQQLLSTQQSSNT